MSEQQNVQLVQEIFAAFGRGDVPGILSSYQAQGFSLRRRMNLEGWATLVLRRGGAAPRRTRPR